MAIGQDQSHSDPTVLVTCPNCGDTAVTLSLIVLITCIETGITSFTFPCSGCRKLIAKTPDDNSLRKLRKAKCRHVFWHLPVELSGSNNAPALTYNDLLYFHLELEELGSGGIIGEMDL